ncbi:MAG TPA: FIST N-terminal domain-containing protein [Candidatus Omnitrophota bacterium]|nr:FIST N-terminal domain-containing protein [Candidatus Omnitrophota bacterium]
MATHIAIGSSQTVDTLTATKEAAQKIKSSLQSTKPDLVLIFSTIHHDPDTIAQAIDNLFPGSKAIGCSSAGIIFSEKIMTNGIGILAIASDEMKFGIGAVSDITPTNIRMAGSDLAKNIVADFGQHGRHVCLFFIDGEIADSSLLLKGVQEVLGNVFPLVGAGSCDDFHFKKNFQIFGSQALEMSACGLIMGGQMSVGVSGRHGWRPLGKPRVITQAEGNIIKTIDGKKASHLYEEYFDEAYQDLRATQLGQMSILYPLGIFIEESNHFLLRNAIDILEDGSIVCQGGVPDGSEVHIMIGNKDSCKEAASEAAQEAHNNLLGKKAKLVIIIESMSRLKLLGRGAILEIAKIREIFGQDIPVFGMYAHGEICPFESVERIKKPYLQNESMVVLAVN